jgi:hypothetical protein
METGSQAALHLGVDAPSGVLEVCGAPGSRGLAPGNIPSLTVQLARRAQAGGHGALEGGSCITAVTARPAGRGSAGA